MKLLIATHNPHKLAEIRSIFVVPSLEILGADDSPGLPDVEEDGLTFEANAIKKAVELAKYAGMWALADDSGLEVDALGGEPGVWSARYAGEPVSYEANNEKLLNALAGREDRGARFRCAMALADTEGHVETVSGSCEGRITGALGGENGFGYDPLFIPEGHEQTFAEMPASLKNRISHRAIALEAARKAWFVSSPFGF